MPPIKVLVLGLRGVVSVQGGIETHSRRLYPLLARLGCCVEVVQRGPYFDKRKRRKQRWHGISLTYIWSPMRPGLETAIHSLLGILYAAVKRPDVVHLHAIGPALLSPLARCLGLRVVVTHHAADYRREKWGRLAKFVLRSGEWIGMRSAHRAIVVSDVIGADIRNRIGVDAEFIPNGVPLALRTSTDDALHTFGIEKGKYILCVARLEPTKRQLDLIAAFERSSLIDWKVVLVGLSDPRSEYGAALEQCAARNCKIVLTGYQTGRALRELFTHCGVFVLPSSLEGHPIALLEAMSYGVPVLASAIPENLAIPLPRGSYFPVGDIAQMAIALDRTAGSPHSCDQAKEIARLVRERYSWKRAAKLTYQVYLDVIQGEQLDRNRCSAKQ